MIKLMQLPLTATLHSRPRGASDPVQIMVDNNDITTAAWSTLSAASVIDFNTAEFTAAGTLLQNVAYPVSSGAQLRLKVTLWVDSGTLYSVPRIGRNGAGDFEQSPFASVQINTTPTEYTVDYTFVNDQTGVRFFLVASSSGHYGTFNISGSELWHMNP